ncbi:MAG: thiol:disulfide interchange protein DsbD [Oleispira sp.]|jgi:thiol:disulfide interchange protein DsbD
MAWIFTRFSFFLLLLLSISSAQAGILDSLIESEPKFLPVGEAFPYQVDQQDNTLSIVWDSADEYYLYRKKILLKQGKSKHLTDQFSQEGILKHDEAFGEVIVFYGQTEALFDLTQLDPTQPVILGFQGCADAGLCYPPQKINVEIDWSAVASAPSQQPSLSKEPTPSKENSIPVQAKTQSTTNTPAEGNWFEGRSWLSIVGLFFLLGLGLTFTPCVLPMVPILTSIVVGQEKHSPAKGFVLSTTYVLGMAITYAIAGITVGLLGAGANISNWMQTPWVLSVFAALFLVLSLSMFGLYELQLPSKLRNRLNDMNQKQKGGNLFGVFLMGVLSALVVSPCVSAPLAGALVYLSTTGDAWLGGSALLALGLGMGAPLIALGTTGASFLPKAGGWMDGVKAFFGVLLIGVAIWLLSRFLDATLILACWALLAIVYAVTLGALDKAQTGKQNVVRGVALALLVYGIVALIGALQGNDDPLNPIAAAQYGNTASAQQHSTASPFTNINNQQQLDQAVKAHLAANPNGAVMLDYYADWCISCKVMEKNVFHLTDVQQHWPDLLWLQVDVTDQTPEQIALMENYSLFGPPSLLFFSKNGEHNNLRILGEMDKAEFINHLNKVKATL